MIDWSPVTDTLDFSDWFLSYSMANMGNFLESGIVVAVIFVVLVVFFSVLGVITRGLRG